MYGEFSRLDENFVSGLRILDKLYTVVSPRVRVYIRLC
jgi:hypothetical protein